MPRQLFSVSLSIWLVALSACATSASESFVQLKGHRFIVEIVNDDAARARGLMFRDTLAADHGMLFLFPQPARQTFWMKNTHIPLDILYFDENRHLINVQQRVPPCQSDPCPTYPSSAPAKYVLELNAGAAEKLELKPGDELSLHD